MASQSAALPPDATGQRRRPGRTGPAPAGFGLLEVLVATTLMGLVLVALLQVLSASLSAQEASLKNSQAVLAAEKVLQEQASDPDLREGEYQGQAGPFTYRTRCSRLYQSAIPQVPGKVACSLIQVTVFWQERGRSKSLKLETVRSASVP